ncbi:hypothetical protein CRE_00976 [Caenorhabditis remanei]|uniref:Uncharacterized protein n=1 Tax=Caenorhabditis remanei TaxID=31234 RepID=E3MIA4_CAERE|nr:hypothetical protein CRE_00976 [Caenorhabditis remanei]
MISFYKKIHSNDRFLYSHKQVLSHNCLHYCDITTESHHELIPDNVEFDHLEQCLQMAHGVQIELGTFYLLEMTRVARRLYLTNTSHFIEEQLIWNEYSSEMFIFFAIENNFFRFLANSFLSFVVSSPNSYPNMSCPVGTLDQFSSYALCSPNLWMIVACSCMTLLTMILMMYMQHGFRRDMRWLQFAQWKLNQLAERLRYQEPNVTLLEQITRKVNEKKNTDKHAFDFFNNNRDANNNVPGVINQNKMTNTEKESNGETDRVAAQVKKAKDDDAEKVLKDQNIDANTPLVPNPQPKSGGSQKILKKWTEATKDILAIDDNNDDEKGKPRVDKTQDD